MKKSSLIITAVLLTVFVALQIFVGAANSPVKSSGDNISVVTAPDQDAAMENEQFTVVEYVPPTIEGTNIALDGHCEANGFNDVYMATCANDGTRDAGSYWEGPAGEEAILTLNMKGAYNIHTIRLGLNPLVIWGKRTQTMSISISDDGENFTELVASADYQFDPDTGNEVVIDIEDVKTQYVRLNITKNTGAVSGQIAEFEVYTNDK